MTKVAMMCIVLAVDRNRLSAELPFVEIRLNTARAHIVFNR